MNGPKQPSHQQMTGKKRGRKPLKFSPAGLDQLNMALVNFRQTVEPTSAMPRRMEGRRPSVVESATAGLLQVFSSCNPEFCFDKSLNPRRVLTKPSRPCYNSGYDNEKHDYILYVNDVIGNEEGRKYVILDLLGQGTFGQVVKCQRVKTGEIVAVKVIKNQPAYFNQSMMEVTVLELLNGKHDPEDRHHIVRMKDTFIFRQHLCVVVELLSLNLYELIRQNQYRGFSLQLCRVFLAQILDALRVLKEAKIIHCDLKPENILLKSLDSPGIKVIDYGSACHEQQTLYTYIQSRFYRSPEVLLGLPYSASIDMWSLGCIAAELFLGLPIFPGASGYDQVSRIIETLGIPPTHMLDLGRDAPLYFDKKSSLDGMSTASKYTLKSRERYSMETGRNEPPSKKYFASSNLEDMILGYPFRPKDMSQADKEVELRNRRVFIDFLRGLLKLNPVERWHPQQALQHPFINGKTPQPPTIPQQMQEPAQQTGSQSKPIQNRLRPRANTLSSLSLQDVPPQIQKIATVSKGQTTAKPTVRSVPETVPTDVEPPALPFEVGSVPKNSASASSTIISTTNDATPPGNGRAGSRSKDGYYVDRLAEYASNRRVSNPPSMFSIRRPRGSRNDSIDEFAPSSLPVAAPTYTDLTSPVSPEQQKQATGTSVGRRGSYTRRASDPLLNAQSITSVPAGNRRKGSLTGGTVPSSSLSRSLTMGDVVIEDTSIEAPTNNAMTVSTSSSSYMDTLQEVSEDDDDHEMLSPEEEDSLQMDID